MIQQAELISTGAELLSGRSVNTHARLLGERLDQVGISLLRDTTVPDDQAVIESCISAAATRVKLIFISGGLGPTNDDVTRDAVAAVTGRPIVMHQPALAQLHERMKRAGRSITPARERQALVIDGASIWLNPAGAAPGECIEHDDAYFILLPGPPNEFEAILDTHVLPWLHQLNSGASALRQRVLMTCGTAEGDIVDRFEKANFPPAGIETAYCASAGRVEIRLHPVGGTSDDALDAAQEEAVRIVGPEFVYARERTSLAELLARELTARGQTLATAESCTGGLIAERLTDRPGSSVYFRGGMVAYADEVKQRLLGVSPETLATEGAVSEQVAREMAMGVRERLTVDYAIAVTGIAGPSGGSAEKPVGLVFSAIAHPTGVDCYRDIFPGNRRTIRELTYQYALMRLWQWLRDKA